MVTTSMRATRLRVGKGVRRAHNPYDEKTAKLYRRNGTWTSLGPPDYRTTRSDPEHYSVCVYAPGRPYAGGQTRRRLPSAWPDGDREDEDRRGAGRGTTRQRAKP